MSKMNRLEKMILKNKVFVAEVKKLDNFCNKNLHDAWLKADAKTLLFRDLSTDFVDACIYLKEGKKNVK